MPAADNQALHAYRGSLAEWSLTGDPADDFTEAELAFYVAAGPRARHAPSLTLTSASGITNQTSTGGFTVSIVRAETLLLAAGVWYWEAWNLTNDQLIAAGSLHLEDAVRDAPE